MLIPYQQLSKEQQGVIRRISRESGDLFVEGPPGSGKTLISLYTLVDIIKESNVRPLLIIYNHSLFGYLSTALKELGIQDNLTIVTKDKFFWDKAKTEFDIRPINYKDSFEVKHSYILDSLLKQDLKKEFDVTLIDEVQDISKKEWDIIDKLSGRVLALGDFNQGVYKTDLTKEHIMLKGLFEKLTEIFRFHKNIAKLAQNFSRTNDNLEALVSKDSSTQPKFIDTEYSNRYPKIEEILNEIKGFRQRIGIICPDRDELSQLSKYLTSREVKNHHYDDNKDMRTHDFSSNDPLLISSFSAKGLEFDHVILFGFEENNLKIQDLRRKDKLKDVIYVSITRTNSYLYVIRTPETVEELRDLVIVNSNSNNLETLEDLF
jgi:DNA helicase IV